jgi:fluoride exporter
LTRFLLISLGAIIGANARYLIQLWFADRGWTAFPWATLLINVVGTVVIAFFITLTTERVIADPNLRFLVAVGFCGSFTTFSSLAFETWTLYGENGWWTAALNIIVSTILGVVATLAGIALARLF